MSIPSHVIDNVYQLDQESRSDIEMLEEEIRAYTYKMKVIEKKLRADPNDINITADGYVVKRCLGQAIEDYQKAQVIPDDVRPN